MNSQPVVVLAPDGAVGTALGDGLASRGLPVLRLASLDDAPDSVGSVVDAGPVAMPPVVSELTTLDGDAWRALAEAPLRRALHVLQQSHRRLSSGGHIVALLPSVVTSGAAGLVPWVAAAEGYRSLLKAAARAWGRDGITVNCVLMPADLIAETSLDRPGLQPPALGRAVDLHSDVAGVVAALLGGGMSAVTGQTIAADGGVWMTP